MNENLLKFKTIFLPDAPTKKGFLFSLVLLFFWYSTCILTYISNMKFITFSSAGLFILQQSHPVLHKFVLLGLLLLIFFPVFNRKLITATGWLILFDFLPSHLMFGRLIDPFKTKWDYFYCFFSPILSSEPLIVFSNYFKNKHTFTNIFFSLYFISFFLLLGFFAYTNEKQKKYRGEGQSRQVRKPEG